VLRVERGTSVFEDPKRLVRKLPTIVGLRLSGGKGKSNHGVEGDEQQPTRSKH